MPRWAWLLLLVPFLIFLLPRHVALWAFPLMIAAAVLGMLYFLRKAR